MLSSYGDAVLKNAFLDSNLRSQREARSKPRSTAKSLGGEHAAKGIPSERTTVQTQQTLLFLTKTTSWIQFSSLLPRQEDKALNVRGIRKQYVELQNGTHRSPHQGTPRFASSNIPPLSNFNFLQCTTFTVANGMKSHSTAVHRIFYAKWCFFSNLSSIKLAATAIIVSDRITSRKHLSFSFACSQIKPKMEHKEIYAPWMRCCVKKKWTLFFLNSEKFP